MLEQDIYVWTLFYVRPWVFLLGWAWSNTDMEGKALDRIQDCMDLHLLFSFYCFTDAQPCNFLQTLIRNYRSILLGRSKILI